MLCLTLSRSLQAVLFMMIKRSCHVGASVSSCKQHILVSGTVQSEFCTGIAASLDLTSTAKDRKMPHYRPEKRADMCKDIMYSGLAWI